MAFSTTWSVEKYKSEYESDEHWELRRKFIEAHKDKFPEDKLVCLARVFFNIEFLGCRYPEKTMQLVSDLSKGVADEFREKQKGKLKRTFVQASDAAGAKIKGASTETPDKKSKPAQNISFDKNSLYSCFVHTNVIKSPEPGDFPGVIIYEHCKPCGSIENCSINILTQTVQKNKNLKNITFDFPPEKNTKDNKCCVVSIDGKILSSANGMTQKEAKLNAATEGLKILRRSCFTIQAKHTFFSDSPEVGKNVATKATKTEDPLPQDNVGCKMMQKMGWTGSGLGKKQQGIEAPIQASAQNVQRAGFGGTDLKKLQSNCRQIFKEYIASGSDHDLIFSPDFSSEERKMLHQSIDGENCLKDIFEPYPDDSGNEHKQKLKRLSDNMLLEMSNKKLKSIVSCIVCNKLKTVNGEESDDDILDDMWQTGSDTTGLTQDNFINHRFSEHNDETVDNKTDDEICDMDVSDDYQDLHVDTLSSESTVQLENSQSKTIHENLQKGAEKCNSPFSLNSFLNGEFSIRQKSCCAVQRFTKVGPEAETGVQFVKIRYTLPKWAVLCICLKCIKEDEILNLYTFPNGHRLIPQLCVDVTINDLKNNPLLWDTMMKYAVCTISPNKRILEDTLALNNQPTGSQKTENENISSTFPFVTQTESIENNINDCKITELGINCSDTSCKVEEKVNQTNEFISSDKKHPDLNSQQNEKNKKIKIILPDGSYKRIPLKNIEENRESMGYTKYFDQILLNSKVQVTVEDLKKYKVLRSLFIDFIASTEPNDIITNKADNLNIGILEENPEPSSLCSKSAFDNLSIGTVPELNEVQHNCNECTFGECSLSTNMKTKHTSVTNNVDKRENSSTLSSFVDNDSMFNALHTSSANTNYTDEKINLLQHCKPYSKPAPISTQLNVPTKEQNLSLKFSLLDGSFKRVPISVVEANEQLREFTKYHPESKVYNFTVTEKHLEKYSELQKMFSDFISLPENLKKDICSTSICELSNVNDSLNVVPEPLLSAKVSEKNTNNASPNSGQRLIGVLDTLSTLRQRFRNPAKARIRTSLMDAQGRVVRFNGKCLKGNKYFMRFEKRKNEVRAFSGLAVRHLPPPMYSDSSSDESDENERWCPKVIPDTNPDFSEVSVEGKTYLNNQWKQFLISFSSASKNPFANKWNELVSNLTSEEKQCYMRLAAKWKEFMVRVMEEKSKAVLKDAVENQTISGNSVNVLSNSLKTDFENSLCSTSSACVSEFTSSILKTDSIVGTPEEPVIRKLVTSHFPMRSHNAHLFELNSHCHENSSNTILNEFSLESCMGQPQELLENHINSSAVTTNIHPSLIENSSTKLLNNSDSVLNPPVEKPKNIKDPNLVTMYFLDGSKIKIDIRLHPALKYFFMDK